MFATLTHGFWFHYPKGISVYWDLADSFEVYEEEEKIDGFAVKEKPKNHREAKKYCNDWLINYIGKGII
tara:strand:+ start:490 stop:696 length:207 start_codon:yes stop_codon:yes gene_type:complete